jgi:putative transposase
VGSAHPTKPGANMPNYRRAVVADGTFFLTIVTHHRRPLFADPENVTRLREALRAVRGERPFEIDAGVVLLDHLHFIWTLPEGDADFSSRVGRMKVLFTKSLREDGGTVGGAHPTGSRVKHRESDVWKRRFWEHVVRDTDDLNLHLDYIHYNPVKHGLVSCPHAWKESSFGRWVRRGGYEQTWCCCCGGRASTPPDFARVMAYEPE